MSWRPAIRTALGCTVTAALIGGCAVAGSKTENVRQHPDKSTATAIQHLVVIVDENVSFDHYFGTYPHALNPPGEPIFTAAPGTPAVNGLTRSLLTANPNRSNPQRLRRSEALTCDQDHDYTMEQQAFDGGRMDRFLEYTDREACTAPAVSKPGLVMDYYDGNTVTALWNYAQRFAMSDNSYSTVFGPSAPGHLNLVSGQTHGALASAPTDAVVGGSLLSTGGARAAFEDCGNGLGDPLVEMTGTNIGDLLSAAGVSWGWFSGGFAADSRTESGDAVCTSSHANIGGQLQPDYYSGGWTEPFQYYRSTANPHHVPPTSVAEIGHAGPANHQYDLADFWAAVDAGTMPEVSYLKPPGYQNGHAGTSDPLDEQRFLVETINRVQRSPEWRSTAVVIVYDDSDGWYDHQAPPLRNPSHTQRDALTGPGACGTGRPLGGYQGRCGYGPRQPLLIISPFSKVNAVDHTVTDQTSILAFIEDNWLGGRRIGDGSFDALAGSLDGFFDFRHPRPRPLYLDPDTGQPTG